jgi:myo-inositol 2-dehydrogenase / D-chiro-inositol 1-dehydrogenase
LFILFILFIVVYRTLNMESIVNRQSSIVNLGIIGVGRWAQAHLEAAREVPGVQVVALCANTAESAERARAEFGLPCDTNYKTFVARPELDAVIVATPNGLHFEISRAALLAGKHVLCEKPMSFTAQECDELIGIAAENGKVLFPGHEFRLFTIWERVNELLKSGTIGKPRWGNLELRRYPYRSGSGGWKHIPALVGDWLLEEPIHYFDLATWFMSGAGKPTSLYAQSSAGTPERALWHENLTALVGYEDGAYVSISRTVASFDFRIRISFTGSEGTLEATWSAPTDRDPNPVATLTLFRFGDAAAQNIEVEQKTGHVYDLPRETAAFAAAALGGAPPFMSGLDGRRAVYLCQAASESLKSGQSVKLDDWK